MKRYSTSKEIMNKKILSNYNANQITNSSLLSPISSTSGDSLSSSLSCPELAMTTTEQECASKQKELSTPIKIMTCQEMLESNDIDLLLQQTTPTTKLSLSSPKQYSPPKESLLQITRDLSSTPAKDKLPVDKTNMKDDECRVCSNDYELDKCIRCTTPKCNFWVHQLCIGIETSKKDDNLTNIRFYCPLHRMKKKEIQQKYIILKYFYTYRLLNV